MRHFQWQIRCRLPEIAIKKIMVINLEDQMSSKAESKRTKDMLDIIELKQIHNL